MESQKFEFGETPVKVEIRKDGDFHTEINNLFNELNDIPDIETRYRQPAQIEKIISEVQEEFNFHDGKFIDNANDDNTNDNDDNDNSFEKLSTVEKIEYVEKEIKTMENKLKKIKNTRNHRNVSQNNIIHKRRLKLRKEISKKKLDLEDLRNYEILEKGSSESDEQ